MKNEEAGKIFLNDFNLSSFVRTTVLTKVAGRAVPARVVVTMVTVSVVPTRLFQLVLLEQRL